jgi:hypothetical protein
MTDAERGDEGAEEPIEDLEAPAERQDDVAGGKCPGKPSMICQGGTCNDTQADCTNFSHKIVVHDR